MGKSHEICYPRPAAGDGDRGPGRGVVGGQVQTCRVGAEAFARPQYHDALFPSLGSDLFSTPQATQPVNHEVQPAEPDDFLAPPSILKEIQWKTCLLRRVEAAFSAEIGRS